MAWPSLEPVFPDDAVSPDFDDLLADFVFYSPNKCGANAHTQAHG
jgi:hypothetical protein